MNNIIYNVLVVQEFEYKVCGWHGGQKRWICDLEVVVFIYGHLISCAACGQLSAGTHLSPLISMI